MKKFIFSLIVFGLICGGPFLIKAAPQSSLADLYKTGKVRLEQELLINDDNLPEGIFFQRPMGVTMDHEDNLYVVDYHAHNIKKFDSSGKFLKLLGREGEGPGEFIGPSSIML